MLRSTPEFAAAHLQDLRSPHRKRLALQVAAVEAHRQARRTRRVLRIGTILRAIPFTRRKVEIRAHRAAGESP